MCSPTPSGPRSKLACCSSSPRSAASPVPAPCAPPGRRLPLSIRLRRLFRRRAPGAARRGRARRACRRCCRRTRCSRGFGPGGLATPAEGSPPWVAAAAAEAPLAAAFAAGAADLTPSPTSIGPPAGMPICASSSLALLASQGTAVAFFSSAVSVRLAGSKRRSVRALCQPLTVRKMWSSLSRCCPTQIPFTIIESPLFRCTPATICRVWDSGTLNNAASPNGKVLPR